ncbi:MAG: hypothetical protein MIO90_05995, partial [Methanomassiliicoccales archaeon]|nr:hypothetical protein [Methanomassiliicoccales archaeon]
MRGEMDVASTFLQLLVVKGLDPILVSPNGMDFTSDAHMVVLEPERKDRSIRTNSLISLLHSLTKHLGRGEGKAVV